MRVHTTQDTWDTKCGGRRCTWGTRAWTTWDTWDTTGRKIQGTLGMRARGAWGTLGAIACTTAQGMLGTRAHRARGTWSKEHVGYEMYKAREHVDHEAHRARDTQGRRCIGHESSWGTSFSRLHMYYQHTKKFMLLHSLYQQKTIKTFYQRF